jgi:hypothetical protein
MQVKSFFEVTIRPMPPDMSQLSVPTFVRLACDDAGIGSAIATAATAATALKALCISNSYFQ